MGKGAAKKAYNEQGEVWHSIRGLGHELLEKPAIYKITGDVGGKRILCAGCGFGEECLELSSRGASDVIGIDNSEASIEKARSQFSALDFQLMDMSSLEFPDDSFDVVFSSLALHYVEDWTSVLQEWSRVLTDSGRIVFSTHHPTCWGASKDENQEVKRQLLGYTLNKETGLTECFGDYLSDREIKGKLGGKFEVSYYHKSLSSMLGEIRNAGLDVAECLEPVPVPECEAVDSTFFEIRSRFPLFILFALVKR